MDVKNDVRQGLLSKEDTNSKLVNSPADLAEGIGPRSSGGGGGGWGRSICQAWAVNLVFKRAHIPINKDTFAVLGRKQHHHGCY